MTEKGLGATWQVFRLTLRGTASEYAKAHVPRVSTLPLEPADPEWLAPMVNAVLAELDRTSVADEASPVLRSLKQAFRPSPEQRERRRLQKAFDAYARAWQARAAT
ncbi:MAG: hypothetical protein KJ062_17390 [Thermoanaerobaculia bacterium]|nr:hypothetical protein [Thermoanaerobaculia bacterium]